MRTEKKTQSSGRNEILNLYFVALLLRALLLLFPLFEVSLVQGINLLVVRNLLETSNNDDTTSNSVAEHNITMRHELARG